MQRKRSELVPIAEAFSDLSGPVTALRDASPQARHHFTQADQVNQLVSASEADPDLGFMARMMALCSLPWSNPGNRKEYKRVNGPYRLYMQAGRRHRANAAVVSCGTARLLWAGFAHRHLAIQDEISAR